MMIILKRRHSSVPSARNGFTLLEVSIAIAIISVVLVALTSLFNASIGISDYAKKATRATFLAQKIMTEMEMDGSITQGTSEIIQLEDDFAGYSYKMEVVESMFPLIQEVKLFVYFESVMKTHQLMLTSYVASPEMDTLKDMAKGSEDESSED